MVGGQCPVYGGGGGGEGEGVEEMGGVRRRGRGREVYFVKVGHVKIWGRGSKTRPSAYYKIFQEH